MPRACRTVAALRDLLGRTGASANRPPPARSLAATPYLDVLSHVQIEALRRRRTGTGAAEHLSRIVSPRSAASPRPPDRRLVATTKHATEAREDPRPAAASAPVDRTPIQKVIGIGVEDQLADAAMDSRRAEAS